MLFSHEYFMKKALLQAQNAFDADEVPVGAIVVCDGQIIAKTYNQVETLQDVTAHAEILAITAATQYLGAKYLNDCTLYITLEPCLMCAGALYWSQIGGIVYGASDDKRGFSVQAKKALHPKTQIVQGILEHDCAMLLSDFFRGKRKFK